MQQIPTTNPNALYETVESGTEVTVLDVRQPQEYERNHIDHSNTTILNVPLNQLQAMDPATLLEDVPTENVVTVCASGNRSRFATRLLNRTGIPAENLQYGMQGWLQVAS